MLGKMTAVAMALVLVACSGLEVEESAHRYKAGELKKLEPSAQGQTKVELLSKEAEFDKLYGSLPAEKSPREKALSALNNDMQKSIDDLGARIERDQKTGRDAAIAAIAGHWKGNGMDITVGRDGAVEYKREKDGTTKSFGGKIQKIDDGSFNVGALGIETTFKIDKRPTTVGTKTLMTIDGAEVTRDP
jgi:hypothetical protein